MKFSICSFLIVFGLLLSLLVVEPAGADCLKEVAADVEPAEAEVDREDVVKTVVKTESNSMQKTPVEPPSLGLKQLVERLKKTEAIGFFTKLAIRSDVLDFQQSVESYRKKKTFNEHAKILRGRFNGLLLKILALLDRDPVLSRDIHRARDSIWISLVEVKL